MGFFYTWHLSADGIARKIRRSFEKQYKQPLLGGKYEIEENMKCRRFDGSGFHAYSCLP